MAAPPTYADLGKAARDIFGKGYNYGTYKLDVTQKSASGVKFKVGGKAHHAKDNKVDATLETTAEHQGVKLVQKFNTDSTLGTKLTVENQLVKGLKLTLDTTFTPDMSKKTAVVKLGYKQDMLNAQCHADITGGPSLHAAAVLGHKGGLFGYQCAFDTSKSELTKNNFALGYLGPDYTAHMSVDDLNKFSGSFHHRVSPALEAGALVAWERGASTAKLELGANYKLNCCGSRRLRAKINNDLQLGLAYEHKIREGVTATLSSLVEAKTMTGHKFGLGLEVEN